MEARVRIWSEDGVVELLLEVDLRCSAFMDGGVVVICVFGERKGRQLAFDFGHAAFCDDLDVWGWTGIDGVEVDEKFFIDLGVGYRSAVENSGSEGLATFETESNWD